MKKIMLFVLLALGAVQANAKAWLNYAGLSLNVPIVDTSLKMEETGEKQNLAEIGYGGGVSYIGVHRSGFLVKADALIGAITSDDVEIQGSGRNVGFYENLSAGLGYAFVNTEKVLFGVAVMGGAEIAQYEDDYTKRNASDDLKHKYTESMTFATGSIGGDIFFAYNLGAHFGLFASAGARYIYGGAGQIEQKDEWTQDSHKKSSTSSSDFDLSGKIVVSPSIGVMWHF